MRRSIALLGLLLLSACDSKGQAVSSREAKPAAGPESARPTEPTVAAVAPIDDKELEPPPDAPSEESPEIPEEELDYVEPTLPAFPEAPETYGKISPADPLPAEEDLVNFALVGYEVVAIYTKPSKKSARLGYMRIGERLRVTAKVAGEDCPGGWYGVPQGGYACSGKGGGLVVDEKREPYSPKPTASAKIDTPFPYEYAYVRKWNAPMYWRVPTVEEQRVTAERRAVREAEREGKALPAATPAATPKPTADTKAPSKATDGDDVAAKAVDGKSGDGKSGDGQSGDGKPGGLADLPKPPGAGDAKDDPAPTKAAADEPTADATPTKADAEPKPATKPATEPKQATEPKPATEPPAEPIRVPLSPEHPWLEKGFFISLGDKVTEEGRQWWKTARGGYVPVADAHKYAVKDFQGNELDAEADFPFGYAMAESPKLVELTEDGKLKAAKSIERRTFLDLSEETIVDGRAYMVTTEGLLIRKDHVRFAERQPIPDGIQPWERWIDVDITTQILVAYEGERPVFTTLVSTGRKGSKEEPFDTPTGRWRIRSKHVSTTMDGDTASDGNYSIQDVPWAMYFFDNYALHGAFWHDSFGRVKSHGCVNLGPTDARWLFNWTTPFLPEGWHGVHAHEGSPGTTVVVRKSE